jgi:translocation and assembly module TamB
MRTVWIRQNEYPMSRPRKLILWLTLTCLASLVVFAGAALYVVQSSWFKEQIREKLVATVEYATGGRVELKSFQYDWHRLTAEAGGFVLRGMEPAGGPPLFSADSVRVQLKLLSAFHRDVDISSMVVNRPQVYLLIREDGSTNIPEPKVKRPPDSQPVLEQLLDLKVRHFEINQGVVEVNLKQAPLDIRGDNLQALLSYEDGTAPRYLVKASSQQLQLKTANLQTIAGDLTMDASLERDQIVFSQVTYRLQKSKVEARGTLVHVANPAVSFQANAEIDVAEAARIVELPELRSGVLTFQGEARYGPPGFVLSGNLKGARLSYRNRNLALSQISLKSAMTLTTSLVTLQGLSMGSLGANFTGRAEVRDYRTLDLDGVVSRLDTSKVGPLLFSRPLPWTGTASGAVHLQASLGKRSSVAVQSELGIEPGAEGIPVSGHIGLAFESRSESLQLTQTVLQFPHSQLEVSGTVGNQLQVTLDSASLEDLLPATALASSDGKPAELPLQLLQGGRAHFAGKVVGQLNHPILDGDLQLDHFRAEGETVDHLTSRFKANEDEISVASLTADEGPLHVSASGSVGLVDWSPGKSSALQVSGQVKNLDLTAFAKRLGQQVPNLAGKADATLHINGSFGTPQGSARVESSELNAFDEHFNSVSFEAALAGNRLQVTKGQLREAAAAIAFSGDYEHAPGAWTNGTVHARASTAGFALNEVAAIRKQDPDLRGHVEFNALVDARIKDGQWLVQNVAGRIALRNVSLAKVDYGSISIDTRTSGGQTESAIRADLRDSQVQGNLRVGLSNDYPMTGSIQLQKITFGTLNALTQPNPKPLPFEGFLQGNVAFSGSLRKLDQLRGRATLDALEVDPLIPANSRGGLKPEDLVLRNTEPILVDYENGEARVRSARFTARDTSLSIAGKVPLLVKDPLEVAVEGSLRGLLERFRTGKWRYPVRSEPRHDSNPHGPDGRRVLVAARLRYVWRRRPARVPAGRPRDECTSALRLGRQYHIGRRRSIYRDQRKQPVIGFHYGHACFI